MSVGGLAGCAAPAASTAPTVVIDTMTEAERAATTSRVLEERWRALQLQFPEAVRPDVSMVRYVWFSEADQVRAECLNDLGFTAAASEDGGVDVAGDQAQREAINVALYTCAAMYPLDPHANAPLNDSQLEYTYWYFTNTLTTCLQSFGVSVSNAPSLEVFKQNFYTEASWSPYADIGESVDWAQINKECPQSGPDLYAGLDR